MSASTIRSLPNRATACAGMAARSSAVAGPFEDMGRYEVTYSPSVDLGIFGVPPLDDRQLRAGDTVNCGLARIVLS